MWSTPLRRFDRLAVNDPGTGSSFASHLSSEALSLKAFAASLYHAERADNYFNFLNNFSEEDLANFVQGLLRQVGIPRLMQESAPQWAQMLKDDGVDAVFLTPG